MPTSTSDATHDRSVSTVRSARRAWARRLGAGGAGLLLALGVVSGCQVPTAVPTAATPSAVPIVAATAVPSLPAFVLPAPTTSATTTTAAPAPTSTSRNPAAVSRSASAPASVSAARPRPAVVPGSSRGDTYTNVDGNQVQRPTSAASAPSGATAHCQDGTYSFSQHHSGTCSGHGGVAAFL